jgi:prepilin-type N-terminal cleavage/methylation domain-containing protein
MFTKGRKAGFTLSEMLIVMGITAMLIGALASFTMFTGRSFVALFNYVDLDNGNRLAMDQFSRDVRQANRVIDFGSTYLHLEDSDLSPLNYDYSLTNRILTRTQNGVTTVVLRDCETLRFDVGARNPVKGKYDQYPAATPESAKVVDVTWVCSRSVFGRKENTENVQSSRIVIRKQGT